MKDRTQSGEPILSIVGERVALDPLRRDLLPLYRRCINDSGTMRTIGLSPAPMTAEKEQDWYERQARTEDDVPFTVYERARTRPIGNAGLHGVDHHNKRATSGIMISEAGFRGRGFGTEATHLMLDYAFTALGLNNVMLAVFAFNPGGIRAYEKAGFKEVGGRRECRTMGGRLYDEVYMDGLASGFESPVLGRVFAPEEHR